MRQIIHRFNEGGIDGITWYAYLCGRGGARRFTSDVVERIGEVALSPPPQLIGLSVCSLAKLREYLFEVIMRRHETRSTVRISNRPLEDWGTLIGDVPSAMVLLDRFLRHAEVITISGRSYRMKDRAKDTTGCEKTTK